MKIDFGQMVFALSDTLDLVGIDEVQHGKRVGYMLWQCASLMGVDRLSPKDLFQMGLLHDCGVSSTRVHEKLISEMDWDGSGEHCEIGAKRLANFPLLSKMTDVVYYHHTHWEDLKRLLLPEEISLSANMTFLLDRVDALAANHLNVDLLQAKEDIRNQIRQYRNTYFNPDLVDAFLRVSEPEAFWLSLEPQHLTRFLHDREKEREPIYMAMKDLKKMAVVFAQIVDAKSPFTAQHSYGVALLSKYIAGLCALPSDLCNKIEIAGLLHDIGKLKIPDEILDKPDRLDAKDMAQMRHHSFETYVILNRIDGLKDIALWAANHHETLSGSGYPFHRKGTELSIESRIISVADVFQALAQDRPYRGAMPLNEILKTLRDFTVQGRLDPDLVSLVEQNRHDCYHAATKAI